MPINILMPALSPTMEKGNLAKWLKKEGDKVKSGDIIAEIETDKATMEVEAVDEGTIAKIVVAEGTADVPVNQVIAVLAEVAAHLGAIYAAQKTGLEKKDVTIDIAEAFAAEMGARPVQAKKPAKKSAKKVAKKAARKKR